MSTLGDLLLLREFRRIIAGQEAIMGKIEDLTAKADSLQSTVDEVQERVQKNSDDLKAQIEELRKQVGQGGVSDEQLQAVIDKLDATQQDLASTAQIEPEPTPES